MGVREGAHEENGVGANVSPVGDHVKREWLWTSQNCKRQGFALPKQNFSEFSVPNRQL